MKLGIRIIDLYRGTDILGKYRQLKKLASDDKAHQKLSNDNMISFLGTIRRSNRYYSPLLHSVSEQEIIHSPLEVLSRLPYTDKHFINRHYQEIFSPIENRGYQKKKTGGSTGEPFYYMVDKEHLSWMWAHNYLFWNRCSGYEPGDPFVTIAGNSLRTVNRQLSEGFYHTLQNNYFIKGDLISADLKLQHNRLSSAVLIYGYPSSIENLLNTMPGLPSHFRKLKAIFTTSEQLLPRVRERIENAFGKPVFDIYGANDGGILGCECTEKNGFHYNSLNCYAETMVNGDGLPELVLTNLSSYNFPFVRYRVGDIGSISTSPCSCGLSWPRITDLKGRARDLIRTREGRSVHGSFFNQIFFRFENIDGYKIVQQADYSVEVFIHTRTDEEYPAVSEEVLRTIRQELSGLDFSISRMQERNPTNQKFKLIESHVS